MATIYCCRECGANLNLHSAHLFPPDFYFEAGNKNTLSFSVVDTSKLRFEKEDRIRPFFETVNYWGIQRKRITIKCNSCGKLVGYIYDDGPPLTNSIGQFGFGPSQVVPRNPSCELYQIPAALWWTWSTCLGVVNCTKFLQNSGGHGQPA